MENKYINPALTVDNIVLKFFPLENKLKVLTIKRVLKPFENEYSLVGGFISQKDKNVDNAIYRILKDKINLSKNNIAYSEQLNVYYTEGRDERGWILTIPNIVMVKEDFLIKDYDFKWVDINDITNDNFKLAFDHNEIVKEVQNKMKYYIKTNQLSFLKYLLPKLFLKNNVSYLLAEIEQKSDISSYYNFVRKLKNSNLIESVNNKKEKLNSSGRPETYYQFI